MRRPSWLTELRTVLTGVDPGFARLRLAGIGTASMMLAAGMMAVVRAATGQAVTLLLLAAVLAMISDVAVTEPDARRRRVTTVLMLGPAAAAIIAGTLLAPHHLVADTVFVAVVMAAVYVRRFGPRGFALGMAGFISYFFTQFLRAQPAQLPWLLLAAAVGITSTLLIGLVFPERPERTLARQQRAFRSRVHTLVAAVADLLTAVLDGRPDAADVERRLREVRKRTVRLNDTALLVQGTLDRQDAPDELRLHVVDLELATERLAGVGARLALLRGHGRGGAVGAAPRAVLVARRDGRRHTARNDGHASRRRRTLCRRTGGTGRAGARAGRPGAAGGIRDRAAGARAARHRCGRDARAAGPRPHRLRPHRLRRACRSRGDRRHERRGGG